MGYNFLCDARSITNSTLCFYDSVDGYKSDFSTNGDVDGWDIYNNVYLYGSWNGMLFGTAYDRSCYVGRSNPFSYISAETHYIIKVMLKITVYDKDKPSPTIGKIRWVRYGDSVWNEDKELEFEVVGDNKWHLYEINMGPAQWWQGDINNIRVYPFVDGRSGDKFAVKYIKISSLDVWGCSNSSCSYYSMYAHPCPGAGSSGYCQAGLSKEFYSTTEDVNDELLVDINNYGILSFRLGTNTNLTGNQMARLINKHLSNFSIGGYAYSRVEYTPVDNKIKIFSGTAGSDSCVNVEDSLAARALGFYDEWGNDVSESSVGTDPASGFDYASARLLTYAEINRLLDDNRDVPAYTHSPSKFSVEGGRRDFFMVGTGIGSRIYKRFNNKGNTLIDISHPFDNNGRIKSIYVYGVIDRGTTAMIKIVRPLKDGSFSVVSSVNMPSYDDSYMYTSTPVVYRVDCNILVQKGDYIGIYNMDPYIGQTYTGKPDAVFFVYYGEPSGVFVTDTKYSYGLGGFPVYARSDRRQTNTIIDIDMGERLNIDDFSFHGREYDEYVEYNIASCLDVNWSVNLFGETHKHHGEYAHNGDGWSVYHDNIAVGTECLDDCVITADNGKAGDGLESLTGEHSYFYVTGDVEWGYKSTCDGTTEFCGNQILLQTKHYERDPIEFKLDFPYGFKTDIHKSIMYFKDNKNFRNFSISSYRGLYDPFGNADKPGYDYITSFESVAIDGVRYSSSDSLIGPYLFSNPTNSDVIIVDGELTNTVEYRTAALTRWNVLEHVFSPIQSAGFRIYCDKHSSTKITELEVYSKFETDPALNDNISMSYSDYGDIWSTATFNEESISEIKSFIGGNPRYFRIEIDAQTKFRLDSMEASVGDQVKVEDCSSNIYLENSKTGVVNAAQKVDIDNVYDVPLDLFVNIPNQVVDNEDLIFWSKTGSIDEINSPEVGPPALIRRRDPYPLLNNTNQCAINNPCYGLKNMVDGKRSYYKINESDWVYYDTLSSGVAINYSNYADSKKTTLSFPRVSSKFWKISMGSSSVVTDILGISVFDGNDLVDINKVYFGVSGGSSGGSYYSTLGDNNNISSVEDLYYIFGSDSFTNYFSFVSEDVKNYVVEDNDGVYAGYIAANSYVSLEYNLNGSIVSFDSEFIIDRNDWGSGYFFDFNFVDSAGNSRLRYSLRDVLLIYSDGVQSSSSSVNIGDYEVKVHIRRRAEEWYINIRDTATDGSQLNWTRSDTLSSHSVTKLKLSMLNYDVTGGGVHYIPISDNNLCRLKSVSIDVVPYFSDKESIIIELYSSQPLDSIVIFPLNSILYSMITVYLSNINSGFYPYVSENGLGVYNTLVTDYFNGAVLDNSIWETYIAPSAAVTVSGSLQLSTLAGDGYEGAICYTKNTFNKEASINIKCKWKPHTDHYSSAPVPGIKIYSPSSVRNTNYGYTNNRNIYFALGYTYDTTQRTRLVVYEGDESTGGIGTQLVSQSISIDESQWHDLDIVVSFENGVCYIDLDNGAYNFNCTVSEDVLDSIGDEFKVEFINVDRNKSNTEYFDDIYIGQSNSNSLLTVVEENYYIYFAIDLENRHALDIIRNYGDSVSKVFLSINTSTDFSNSFVDDPNLVEWDNSTYDDSRWLRIPLLCGDGTDRYIRKLGIYPNIANSVCHNGGYNCSWEYLGNFLTDYTPPINVASGILNYNNYVAFDYPDFSIDEVDTTYWSFYKDDIDPFIEVDLGDVFTVDKFVVCFGSADENIEGLVTDYTISTSTTVSGSNFMDVVTVTDNSYFERTHYLSIPSDIRRVKLTINGFDSDKIRVDDAIYYVGYIRGFGIWTASVVNYIDSETWPIVCLDLIDSFFLSGHELVNKDPSDDDTDWDNDESFFRYAESPRDDPHKVSFYKHGSYQTVYSTSDSSGDMQGDWEYVFDYEVYLHEGQHIIEWDSYNSNYEEEVSIRFEGDTTIDIFASVLSTSWASQKNTIFIHNSGYYSVKGVQHIDRYYVWGVRNIHIYRSSGHYRWVSVVRDTAENYSYDDDSSKYGKDYLSKIKIYSKYGLRPTEYSWWWNSNISVLSNNYIYTKKGERSLQIDYPTSSGVDTIRFIEGDTFGKDQHWSVNDYLSFWWYIDDIYNIDSEFGYISFGVIESNEPMYYTWNISNITLNSGWNNIKLEFERADYVSWKETYNEVSSTLYEGLDFKNNELDFESFKLMYKGTGNSLRMYIDDMRITRSEFKEVKFGDGVCLFDNDFLEVPVTGMSLEKGTIEFWYKFFTNSSGYDIFNKSYTRTLFTATNNNNDFIAFIIAEHSWFQILLGNMRDFVTITLDQKSRLSRYMFSRGDIAHFSVVWSNDGSFTDNGDTLRFYINNELVIRYSNTWDVGDTKHLFLKFGGALSQINTLNNYYDGCGIVDNIKLYNYCKKQFDINSESSNYEKKVSANKFLELSSDNVNFYGQGSVNLPLYFEKVPVGNKVRIYVRSNKDDSFVNSPKTGNLLVEWVSIV